MRRRQFVFALLASALLAGPAAAAEPVKIRSAWVVPVANWPSIILEKKDLAKHLGRSYVLEPVRYNGTPPMITAMANGELEIANLAYSSLALAIENAGMDDIRVIADEFQDGVAGYHTNEFFVLADSPVHKVEDLKGKVLATNAQGSAVDIAMRVMLRKHGLEDRRDYTVVEAAFPTMRAMLAEKKVEMIPAVVPFSFDPELRTAAGAVRLAVHRQGLLPRPQHGPQSRRAAGEHPHAEGAGLPAHGYRHQEARGFDDRRGSGEAVEVTRDLPLPACGERVGVRGPLRKCGFVEAPSPGSLRDPTSPRKRGEVSYAVLGSSASWCHSSRRRRSTAMAATSA